MGKWKILDVVDEGVNSETRTLFEYWGLLAKSLIRQGICLSGLLGIHFSLKKLVVFLDIHSLIFGHLY